MLAEHPQEWLFRWGCRRFLQKSYATEYILIRGDMVPHLLPELHYAPHQKAWLAFGRQISLLHPELKSFGVGHCLLLLEFPDVPAGEFRVGWWQEILLGKTWWCRWGLVIILYLVSFTCPLRESKRGPYLMCQFFMVIHSMKHH